MNLETFRYQIMSGDDIYYIIPWMSPHGTRFSIGLYFKEPNGSFSIETEAIFHHLKLQKNYGVPVKELKRNIAYIEGMTFPIFKRVVNRAAAHLFSAHAVMGESMGSSNIASGRFCS